jgi:hypothetical protein
MTPEPVYVSGPVPDSGVFPSWWELSLQFRTEEDAIVWAEDWCIHMNVEKELEGYPDD